MCGALAALAGQMAGVTLFWALAGCMWGHLVLGLGWTNVGSPCSGPWLDKCGVTLFWASAGQMWGHLVLGLGWTNVGSPCSGPRLDKCGVTLFWASAGQMWGHLVLGLGWTNVGSPCFGPWLDKCGVTLFWALAGQMAACRVGGGLLLLFKLSLEPSLSRLKMRAKLWNGKPGFEGSSSLSLALGTRLAHCTSM